MSESWKPGGPQLPIEFSRISETRLRILTLVIDSEKGAPVQTWFAVSSHIDLDHSIRDLRIREATIVRHIGFVNLVKGTSRNHVFSETPIIVQRWARANGFDSVIWTDLPPNFREKRNIEFSVSNAASYLKSLPKAGMNEARKYIIRAPMEINTPLRRELWNDR